MFEVLFGRLCTEISGVRAKHYVSKIASFHRIQASPGYDEALRFVEDELKRMGIETRVSEFIADGKTETYDWTAPVGWTIRSGSLHQIAPTERRLCLYAEIPQAVLGQSAPGQAQGDLVHVGEGAKPEDFEGIDFAGRFVLTTGRPMQVLRKLRGKSVAGIILYPTPERAAPDYDLVQYAGLFPKAEELADLPMGFSISRRAADGLLKQMAKGPVTVRGEVDAEFSDHPMRVLEAWIPGSDPETGEVLLVAHLCHPAQSANDNASGSGLLVEVARVLRELSVERPLGNTVRLIWVPEFNGTIPWAAANEATLRRAHFVLNLDMVGQSPEIIGEPLRVFRAPNARPTYLNACFEPILARIAATADSLSSQGSRRPLHYVVDAPSGGSDHLVFNAAPFDLPAPMFGHDDPYWHTDLDTVDKVDPTRLKQVGILTAILAALPTWASEDAELLGEWLLAFSAKELARGSRLARSLDPEAGQQLLRIAQDIEEARLRSLETLTGGCERSARRDALRAIAASLGAFAAAVPSGSPSDPRPRCVKNGPVRFTIVEGFNDDDKAFFEAKVSGNHGAAVHSLVGLCDGMRSIEEIALCMTLEFDESFAVEDARRSVGLLVQAGYVEA
ncbi:DUF4910 domain-containing protein [Candidatus Bipolaricaulota bacterium]|nr:DUF4910 domain-containing protein [Candidatus Bipolaricaulota bacterium]